MSDTTIAWTKKVWNPVRGCSKVSSGCVNCYAERMAARFCGAGKPYNGLVIPAHFTTYIDEHRGIDGNYIGQNEYEVRVNSTWTGKARFVHEILNAPLKWREPSLVFVNSMSDLFHDDITNDQLDAIFGVMWACLYIRRDARDSHTFQVLTKRPRRMLNYLSTDRREAWATHAAWAGGASDSDRIYDQVRLYNGPHPRIHLGVSVENQDAADERIPLLLQCPASVRWVSCEPLLGEVDLRRLPFGNEQLRILDGLTAGEKTITPLHLNWVVCGGESGPQARPMRHGWATSLRDQCKSANIPFFFKQWGEWLDNGTLVERVGKKRAGNMLDGICYKMMPDDKW